MAESALLVLRLPGRMPPRSENGILSSISTRYRPSMQARQHYSYLVYTPQFCAPFIEARGEISSFDIF